ncbi:MAG: 30S ribosomal protein S17 [Legionellales bacterium]|nr:30S ribosomal protein S17 [Legionellales bacterium]|tara:strand:+ start:537 stop:797 length:261 start_codon:yes stop_codon:yes gene_type:complete
MSEKQARFRQGVVISAKADKTRVVRVDWARRHERVGKVERRRTKYHVHDENNTSKEGDLVRIQECRPYSKTKSWKFVEVVKEGSSV